MADTQTKCRFHKDAVHSFCTRHGIYCCPECHRRSNPACSVLTKDDAINYFQGELKTSASKLNDVTQNCHALLASLKDTRNNVLQENETAINYVTTFCDQLHSTIDSFRQQSLDKIKMVSTERVDRITVQLQTCEELKAHMKELKETADINDIPGQTETISTDQIPHDLLHFNTVTNHLDDGLASAEIQIGQIGEFSSDQMDHSIPITIDPSINTQLCDQMTAIRESIGKYPEGCRGSIAIGRSEPSVQSDCGTEGLAEGHAATQHIPTESGTPRIFREHYRFSHPGRCRVVRFTHTLAGLRIVVSSTDPYRISIVDHRGLASITKEMDTLIYDMCVRDDHVYVTAPHKNNIRVYRLSDLDLVRQITTVDAPRQIICTNHDIVVSFGGINDIVRRITETGEVTHTSSCKFNYIRGILEILRGGNIFVSDYLANTIVILSADLSHITNITGPHIVEPWGLCLIGDSVFVACHGSRSVIELDAHGSYTRTALGEQDRLHGPAELSYDNETTKFVVSPYSGPILVFVGES